MGNPEPFQGETSEPSPGVIVARIDFGLTEDEIQRNEFEVAPSLGATPAVVDAAILRLLTERKAFNLPLADGDLMPIQSHTVRGVLVRWAPRPRR